MSPHMTRNRRLALVLLIGCTASLFSHPLAPVARAQERVASSVVDGVVSAVCQKQIVLLGELPTHGEALAFEAKSKIVDRLISQCGFGAVLFEAPVYDFVGLERSSKAGKASADQLDNAIGRFWWTRELAPWRRALFDAAAKQRIVLGGIDDQVSITSLYGRANLAELVAAASAEGQATACRQTVTRNLNYTYDTATPFDEPEQRRLQQCARDAAARSAANRSFDAADRVMLENFSRYADRQPAGDQWTRDESMSRNVAWHLDRLPPNTKVIVWTATVHAAKQRGASAGVPMGARIVERWGERVGSVGFTAFGGFTSRAARPAAAIAEAPADSLEAKATTDSTSAFLNAKALRALGPISSRLLGKFTTDTWSNYFDVVVVFRQEVAPTFDPWK